MVTRRNLVTGIGGIATGAIALSTLPDKIDAQITVGEFRVEGAQKETSEPINGAHVSVEGSYLWESGIEPSRVVLRLEGKTTGEFQQLTATELPTSESSGSYNLRGNLLDLSGLTAPELTPDSIGETINQDVTLRLTLTVFSEGSKMGSQNVRETASIEVTKAQPEINMQVGGTATIEVSSG